MSDKITTLHLKNDPSTNVYPNVKIENIPLDVTIAQGGANLATSGTIYDYLQTHYISVNEDGDITREISSTDSEKNYKVTIGNGLLSLTALDEEDTTIFNAYGFTFDNRFYGYPNTDENAVNGDLITDKWSGFSEYAKKGDLNLEYSANDFLSYFGPYEEPEQGYYKFNQKTKIPNGIYILDTSEIQSNKLNLNFNQFYNILISPLVYNESFNADGDMRDNALIQEIANFYTNKDTYITFYSYLGYKVIFIVFGNIIYIDRTFEV